MRNLTLTATTTTAFHNANISATTIDLDEGVIYAASERQSPDGEVEVEIWKMPQTETGEKVNLCDGRNCTSTYGMHRRV